MASQCTFQFNGKEWQWYKTQSCNDPQHETCQPPPVPPEGSYPNPDTVTVDCTNSLGGGDAAS